MTLTSPLRRIAAAAVLMMAFTANASAFIVKLTCQYCNWSANYDSDSPYGLGGLRVNIMPTCIIFGFGDFVCVRCDRNNSQVEIPALGHDWGDATHTDATCTTGSYDEHSCNRCGATEQYNEAAALGHSYGEDHLCTRCGDDYGAVSYIAADGVTVAECSDYKFIVGEGNVTLGNATKNGWYAVYGDVSLTKLTFNDKTVNLILIDGATLTIETTTQTDGIEVGKPMNIYGQSGGTGRLVINAGNAGIYAMKALGIYGGTVTSTGRASNGIQANGNLTIAGGTVSGTSTLNGNGIYSMSTLSVSGGNVTATGGTGKDGMYGYDGITLSWTGTATNITATSYGGSLTLAKSFLGSDGNIYASGAVADASILNGVTLTGADILYDTADNDVADIAGTTNVALYGRTIYRDGDWNTLCLPFPLATLTGTPLEGFTVMELDGTASHLDGDGTLYLNFKASDGIEAGKPYIVKSNTPTYTTTSGLWGMNGTNCSYMLDGDESTLWMTRLDAGLTYCEFQADAPVHVTGYTVASNHQNMNCRMAVWTLQAKLNEGDAWTTIDSRNGKENADDLSPRFWIKTYNVQQPGNYQYFRLEVTQPYNSDYYIHVCDITMQGNFEDISNPVFEGVSVSSDEPASVSSTDGAISFVGSYSPVVISGEDKGMLYLGAANTLYYPNAAMTIGSCRAVFRLGEGITAGDPASAVRAFVLSFGDDHGSETGIWSIDHSPLTIDHSDCAWYSLDGRRLAAKPTAKGIYINKGKKIVIK